MEKHQLYGIWHKYKNITLVVLIAGTFIFSVAAVLALRSNNLGMLELKQQVINADADGGDVEKSLNTLRNFVFSHMNTKMRDSSSTEPPVQLANRYNQHVHAQQELANQNSAGQPNVYADAQAACEKDSLTIVQRANCIQAYVSEKSSSKNIYFTEIPKEFYTFDFASPTWSPDLAGFSIVIAGLFSTLLLARLTVGFLVKSYLK